MKCGQRTLREESRHSSQPAADWRNAAKQHGDSMNKTGSFPQAAIRLFLCTVMLTLLAEPPAWSQANVLTQHNDNFRDGLNSSEAILNPSNVNGSQFGLLFKAVVDDQVYTQPLYVANVSIAGGSHNVVYVATSNNSVYAFDADSGKQYWHSQFGPAFTIQNGGFTCKDVLGTSGIMGTPVIDPGTNTLYVVAQTWVNNTSTHYLHAINLATGLDNAGSPVVISANGFKSKYELQRAGLLLSKGTVYIAFAGHCDQGTWAGYTMAYSTANLAQTAVFNASPNDNGSAIWQSGNGPAADSTGSVYLVTGNGTWDGSANFSESFLKLDSTLKLQDWYTPSNHASLDSGDVDLTSSGPLLIPNTGLVVGGGKDGVLRLLKTGAMGHVGEAGTVQRWQATSSHIHSLNFWNNNLYLWGQSDYLKVYSFNGATFNTTPKYQLTVKGFNHPGGSLSLSSNGNTNGILWAATNTTGGSDGQGAWHSTVPGILYAYNATDMTLLWTSEQNSSRDSCGNYAKFTPPTIANGKVYLPSFGTASTSSGQLCVYGALSTTNLIADGTYRLVDSNSGKALDDPAYSTTAGAAMEIYAINSGTNQRWTVRNLGNNIITLTNNASNQLLDVTGSSQTAGALVVQQPTSGRTSQQWRVTPLAGGKFELVNVNSGMALDVKGGSTANQTKVGQWPYHGTAWEQWTFQTP